MNDKLKLISPLEEGSNKNQKKTNQSNEERQILQAELERLWLINPEQFDPMRNTLEQQRIERTWNLITKHIDLKKKLIADLGCGFGCLSQRASLQGGIVDAVDISSNALKRLKEKNIDNLTPIQTYVPKTFLQDDHYDVVISTELIGFLPKQEDRLYFAEIARLVKSEGYVICSTSLDIRTEGALQKFASLAETEFQIIDWQISHHAFFIRINNFFKAPHRFSKASNNYEYKEREISKRTSFAKRWFKINSSKPLGIFWSIVSYVTAPIVYLLEKKASALHILEKICRFISPNSGISHAIFIGKRHPVWQPTPEELQAISHKGKKQVWE